MFCVALNIFPDRKKNPQVATPKSIALSNYWNVNYWEDLANNFGIIFRTHKRQLNFFLLTTAVQDNIDITKNIEFTL